MNLSETIKLLSRFPKNPFGVYDEIKVRLELRREQQNLRQPSYAPAEFEDVISNLGNCLQKNLHDFLTEKALVEIEKQVSDNIQKISPEAPFPVIHNGDRQLAQLCYALCRATKPAVFVETGVAYGVTSAFILKALEVNGRGRLYSIDRAPFARNAKNFIGALIPEDLKVNWKLYRGQSKKILPGLFSELKQVDIFLHDSRHTYSNMNLEFQTAAPYLSNRSILIADDVNRNVAFQEWITQTHPAFWATIAEKSKESLFGVSVFLEKPNSSIPYLS